MPGSLLAVDRLTAAKLLPKLRRGPARKVLAAPKGYNTYSLSVTLLSEESASQRLHYTGAMSVTMSPAQRRVTASFHTTVDILRASPLDRAFRIHTTCMIIASNLLWGLRLAQCLCEEVALQMLRMRLASVARSFFSSSINSADAI